MTKTTSISTIKNSNAYIIINEYTTVNNGQTYKNLTYQKCYGPGMKFLYGLGAFITLSLCCCSSIPKDLWNTALTGRGKIKTITEKESAISNISNGNLNTEKTNENNSIIEIKDTSDKDQNIKINVDTIKEQNNNITTVNSSINSNLIKINNDENISSKKSEKVQFEENQFKRNFITSKNIDSFINPLKKNENFMHSIYFDYNNFSNAFLFADNEDLKWRNAEYVLNITSEDGNSIQPGDYLVPIRLHNNSLERWEFYLPGSFLRKKNGGDTITLFYKGQPFVFTIQDKDLYPNKNSEGSSFMNLIQETERIIYCTQKGCSTRPPRQNENLCEKKRYPPLQWVEDQKNNKIELEKIKTNIISSIENSNNQYHYVRKFDKFVTKKNNIDLYRNIDIEKTFLLQPNGWDECILELECISPELIAISIVDDTLIIYKKRGEIIVENSRKKNAREQWENNSTKQHSLTVINLKDINMSADILTKNIDLIQYRKNGTLIIPLQTEDWMIEKKEAFQSVMKYIDQQEMLEKYDENYWEGVDLDNWQRWNRQDLDDPYFLKSRGPYVNYYYFNSRFISKEDSSSIQQSNFELEEIDVSFQGESGLI